MRFGYRGGDWKWVCKMKTVFSCEYMPIDKGWFRAKANVSLEGRLGQAAMAM